jgi:hypothetical protein
VWPPITTSKGESSARCRRVSSTTARTSSAVM